MPVSPISARVGPDLVDEVELALFGEDLLLTDDLQVTASGDYALVQGMAALRQALLNRLLTAPGEYAVRPDYGVGIRRWVKKRLNPSELDALRALIVDQIAREDRIERVKEVAVTREDHNGQTGVRVVVKVIAIGREQTFVYPASNFILE